MTTTLVAAENELFRLLEAVALAVGRCPTNEQIEEHLKTVGFSSAGKPLTRLCHAGRCAVTVYGKNWRVVKILGGPAAGCATAQPPHGETAYLRIDRDGRRRLTETPAPQARYTEASRRGMALHQERMAIAIAVSGASAPFARAIGRTETIEMIAAAIFDLDAKDQGFSSIWSMVQQRTREQYLSRATVAFDVMLNISRRNREARDRARGDAAAPAVTG